MRNKTIISGMVTPNNPPRSGEEARRVRRKHGKGSGGAAADNSASSPSDVARLKRDLLAETEKVDRLNAQLSTNVSVRLPDNVPNI